MEVGFFDFQTLTNLKDGLLKLKILAARIGCSEILFQVDPSSHQYKALSTILESKESWVIGYYYLAERLEIEDFGFNFADLDTF